MTDPLVHFLINEPSFIPTRNISFAGRALHIDFATPQTAVRDTANTGERLILIHRRVTLSLRVSRRPNGFERRFRLVSISRVD